MPAITATPNPVTSAGDPFDVDGTGFEVRQTRLVFNGVTGLIFRPALDGTFTQSFVASADTTQTVRAEQCVAGAWTVVANLTVTIGSVYTPPGTPFADMAGWQLTFADEFDREVPRGHILDGSTDGRRTADGRYIVYPSTWTDTSHHGHYDPTIIEITGGKLDFELLTRDGYPRVGAMIPRPTGASSGGGQLGMRYHLECRADSMPLYKGVPLLWPDSGVWPRDGEINWPEGNFDAEPKGFMHRQGTTIVNGSQVGPGGGPYQDFIDPTGTVDWQTTHVWVLEWIAGTSCKFFLDGVQQGSTLTSYVPTTAMHMVLQFETSLSPATIPNPLTTGHVEIERLGIWRPV